MAQIEHFLLIDSSFKNFYSMAKYEKSPTSISMLPKLDDNDPPVGFVKPLKNSQPFIAGFYWIFAKGNRWSSQITTHNNRAKDSNIIKSINFKWSSDVDHQIFNASFIGYNYVLPIGQYNISDEISDELEPWVLNSTLVLIQDRRAQLKEEVRSQARETISIDNAIKLQDTLMTWFDFINVSCIGLWTWIPSELMRSEGTNNLDMLVTFRQNASDDLIDDFLHMVSMISRNSAISPDLTIIEQLLSNDNNWDAGTGTSLYLNSDKPRITISPKDVSIAGDKYLAALFTFAALFPRKRDETADDYVNWVTGLSQVVNQMKWVKLNLSVIKYLRFGKIYNIVMDDETLSGTASALISSAPSNAMVLSRAKAIIQTWPFVLNDLIRSDT